MCYTVEQLQDKVERKAVRDNIKMDGQLKLDFFAINGFAHPELLVLTGDQPLSYKALRWGLIPNWCKTESQARDFSMYTLNAKSETIFEKPSFRTISSKRCILPVNGFFEWREYNKKKYPYFIYPKEDEMFSVGCLWDTWINKETGEVVNSFSIITTEANPMMAKIHNNKLRMPLILNPETEQEWIDPKLPKERIIQLMQPYNQERMCAHTISKLITSRKENPNVPHVIEKFEYPELLEAS